METVARTGDVEAGADLGFERRWWRFQRVAWVLLAAFVAAAVAGVFGRGPVATATAAGPGVRVEYERFARRHSQIVMKIHLDRDAVRGGRVRVGVAGDVLDGLRIEKVTPPPDATTLIPDGVEFTFATDPAADGLTILVGQTPTAAGRFRGRVTVSGGPPVEFAHLVYP